MKTFAVIGLGRFGSRLAETLTAMGNEVLAVDFHENLVDKIADNVTTAVCADCRDKEILKRLGAADVDCVIVAIGSDLAAASLITMNLKELNAKKVICKAHDTMYSEIMSRLGADSVVIPEREYADWMSKSLSLSEDF